MIRSKAITLSLSAALLVSAAGVAGCNTREPANTNVRTKNVLDGHRLGVNSLRDGNTLSTRNNGTGRNMSNLTVSQDLADKISAMKEVKSANVLVAGDSAYVAVVLDKAADHKMNTQSLTGTNRSSSFNNRGFGPSSSFNNRTNMNTTGFGTTGTTGTTGMTGTTTGTTGMTGTTGTYGTTTGTTNGLGMTGTGTYGTMRGITNGLGMNSTGITRSNGYHATTYGTAGTSDTLGTTGTTGTGTTGVSNTYSTDTVSTDIKNKISDVVKNANPSIANVYVSANPDFVQRVSNFATEVSNGRPISGLVSEFTKLVDRIFPMNASNYNHDNNLTSVPPRTRDGLSGTR